MVKLFKAKANPYEKAYNKNADSKLLPFEKSVVAKVCGREVLIYTSNMINEIIIGSKALVYDYIISDVIGTKNHNVLVVCTKC